MITGFSLTSQLEKHGTVLSSQFPLPQGSRPVAGGGRRSERNSEAMINGGYRRKRDRRSEE